MSEPSALKPLFEKIDFLKPQFINRLSDAVSIPSVSSDEELRPKVFDMAHYLKDQLTELGGTDIELKDLGIQPPPVNNPKLNLPPIVLAKFGTDSKKLNVLVYGHYDVQPALVEDGWPGDPFKLIQVDDKLIGRGSTDDKGPVMGWLNVIQAHREAGLELPVNLWFCLEGMEESGSLGLDDLIKREANEYFKGVDAVCISDNYWLGTSHPVLTYGLRGCNYYQITVEGPAADLHSGLFGGIIAEPMTDLIQIMSKLVDINGKIQIPGIDEMVAPVTPEEEEIYEKIHFQMDELHAATGSTTSLFDNTKETLMGRWRYPSLSLHGIEGAFSASGAKTVIPHKVIGKFSIRTVPNIISNKLDNLVFDYVNNLFKSSNSKNQLKVELIHDGDYWYSNPNTFQFNAAKKATKAVWGVEPDLTREGGSIPITLTFEQELKTSVLLLPMGRGDDGAHSVNEKLNVSNYIQGTKTLGAYLHYVAAEKQKE